VTDTFEEKRPFTGNGRRPVTLLQDNARSHKAKKTLETMADLGWEILPYAAYSPGLAPNYHLFRSLQHHLSKSQFKSVEVTKKSR